MAGSGPGPPKKDPDHPYKVYKYFRPGKCSYGVGQVLRRGRVYRVASPSDKSAMNMPSEKQTIQQVCWADFV